MWVLYIIELIIVLVITINLFIKNKRKKSKSFLLIYEDEEKPIPTYIIVFIIGILLIAVEFLVINNVLPNIFKSNKTSEPVINEAMAIENTIIEPEIKPEQIPESKPEPEIVEMDDIETLRNVIFLTFDDGPSLNITPLILDVLRDKKVPATFFVCNVNENTKDVLKREADEGHSIGLHTISHVYEQVYSSEDAFMSEINELRERVKSVTGQDTKLLRFPGGSSNTISNFNPGIMSRLVNIVTEQGYHYFDWNGSAGDASGSKTPPEILETMQMYTKPGHINVMLCHDFGNAQSTADALGAYIDWARAQGFTFQKITYKTPMITHSINN